MEPLIIQNCTAKKFGAAGLTNSYSGDYWYFFLEYIGGVCCLVLFLAMYSNKDLQVHPMKLIMVISLMESLIHCGLSMMPYICTFKLNKLFALTVFMSDDIYH